MRLAPSLTLAFMLCARVASADPPGASSGPASGFAAASPFTPRGDLAWRRALRAARAANIARLRAYVTRGQYPRNHDTPPSVRRFVDSEGRHCAMADMIARSGHEDLVAETARTRNDVALGAVSDGPLYEWIVTSGLTRAEVAFVQEPDSFIDLDSPEEARREAEATEDARLRAHFLEAIAQLERNTRPSLAAAFGELGLRRIEAPPTPHSPRRTPPRRGL